MYKTLHIKQKLLLRIQFSRNLSLFYFVIILSLPANASITSCDQSIKNTTLTTNILGSINILDTIESAREKIYEFGFEESSTSKDKIVAQKNVNGNLQSFIASDKNGDSCIDYAMLSFVLSDGERKNKSKDQKNKETDRTLGNDWMGVAEVIRKTVNPNKCELVTYSIEDRRFHTEIFNLCALSSTDIK